MIRDNGKNGNEPGMVRDDEKIGPTVDVEMSAVSQPPVSELATRAKQRAHQQFQQNRMMILGAGVLVVALLIFVAISMPRTTTAKRAKAGTATGTQAQGTDANTAVETSLFPITDSGRPAAHNGHDGFLNERDLERTMKPKPNVNTGQPANPAGTLASIPPFGEQNWQAPPYQPGTAAPTVTEAADSAKMERESSEKASLVFVRSVSSQSGSHSEQGLTAFQEPGLGLPTGTRLRARLESAASSAVRTPVVAVIEYNYEKNGEIVVPAGTRAVGHMQDADRSGYARVQFDSLQMPDGATIAFDAVATDLQMKPLRGKVEGKNTGKNVLVRSLSGIGQAGAMLVGRGSLDQPLSEGDLVRERVSTNIGEASDEQISRLAITQHVVVTIPAGSPIYIVIEQGPKTSGSRAAGDTSATTATNNQELRQLLQLQRELNQTNATPR